MTAQLIPQSSKIMHNKLATQLYIACFPQGAKGWMQLGPGDVSIK